MRPPARILRLLAVLVIVASIFGASEAAPVSAPRPSLSLTRSQPVAKLPLAAGPLETALVDPPAFYSREAPQNFERVREAGASTVRLILYWASVVPRGARPARFNPANPSDPAYRWSSFDEQVKLATAHGLRPIVCIQLAPLWAERGTTGATGTRSPDPAELAAFARAAAVRYSGSFQGLPRVRYWQAWNEPNSALFLTPQSAGLYRDLVNAFAAAVKTVHSDNLVIAGGLTPFGFRGVAAAPLRFMRQLLCLSAGANPRPTCSRPVIFDVWSHHPYTTGGPFHSARGRDDVSLGDLPEMRRLLAAAVRAGHVVSPYNVRFWVTEFSWDSSPPDPLAVPARLHARWVAEALYVMWRSGVSLVTWFQLRDDPLDATQFQSGLYQNAATYASAAPKLALTAFRFPFVSYQDKLGILYWGRTPGGRAATVLVERSAGAGWKTVQKVRANRFGIFTGRLAQRLTGSMRARLAGTGDASLAFSLKRESDRYYWPFGCGGILACTS